MVKRGMVVVLWIIHAREESARDLVVHSDNNMTKIPIKQVRNKIPIRNPATILASVGK